VDDDPRPLHRRALTIADEHVDGIGAPDLANPTPCDQWTLADLLAHMIGQHEGFAFAVRAGTAPVTAFAPVPFSSERWRSSVATLLAAVEGARLDDTAVLVEIAPAPLSLSLVVGAQLLDTVVHTWDIARSLDGWYEPPDELADAVAELATLIPDDPDRSGDDLQFGPSRPGVGTPWQRALARLGRDPAPPDQRRAT
jgi:uncharacterized protein (TIGR03086 family)